MGAYQSRRFTDRSRFNRMALTYRKKIQKEGKAPIDELEQNVAQSLYDLEQGSDLKSEMKYLYILSAREVVVADNKTAIVIVIPFRQITQFRRIHTRLTHELEKKFAKNVVIIAQRRILQKPGRNNRVSRQKRPNSRTLTSVHNAMLEEVVFPAEITGKRLRYRLDGSKQLNVYLDKKDEQTLGDKMDTFRAVYSKLTGKETLFTFDSQYR